MPEAEVRTDYIPSLLLQRLEWVLEKRYTQAMNQVAATELGLFRAMTRMLSKTEPPDLPRYEESLRRSAEADGEVALPPWQVRFIQANQGFGGKWSVRLDEDDA